MFKVTRLFSTNQRALFEQNIVMASSSVSKKKVSNSKFVTTVQWSAQSTTTSTNQVRFLMYLIFSTYQTLKSWLCCSGHCCFQCCCCCHNCFCFCCCCCCCYYCFCCYCCCCCCICCGYSASIFCALITCVFILSAHIEGRFFVKHNSCFTLM